jgi:hypothetical protein
VAPFDLTDRPEVPFGAPAEPANAWVRGSVVLAGLVQRLGHDVRLRYPDADIAVADEVIKMFVGDGWHGEGMWVEPDDELSANEAEEFIAQTAGSLVDNGWPDEETWPVCPTHRDHPLQLGMLRGSASWLCT